MAGGTGVFLQNRDFFGAMVVHVPLLDALREAEPDAPLVVYSPFERGRLFAGLGLADEVHVYSSASGALWSDVRERRFERLVLLRPQSFGLTALLSTAGARRTLGYGTTLSKLVFSRTIRRDTSIYRPRNYVALLAGEVEVPEFPSAIRRLARRSLRATAPRTIVLMPCGSETRKLWGETNFTALARRFVEADPEARFLLVLGGGERRYVDVFERAGLGARTSALIDGSLADIARTVLAARVVIANDCGPSHVAQLAGVPVVLVFGNWDGAARVRIAEWFDPRPGACCLTNDRSVEIETIGVDAVFHAAREVERDPLTPGRVLEIEPAHGVRSP